MKILTRYILLETLVNFAICISAFTGLLLTARILKFANLIINKGVEFKQIAMVFVAITPTFLEIALPMATLLGIMMAFGRMSGDSEVVVIRASGISLMQLIKPIALFGVFALILNFYVSVELRPWGYRTLSKTFFEIARTRSTAGLSEGVFNKLGNLTLYSEEIDDKTGALKNVLIDDKREGERRQIIFAKSGVITSNSKRETIEINLADGVIHEVIEGDYPVTQFQTNSWEMRSEEIYNPDAKENQRRFREMSLAELEKEEVRYSTFITLEESKPTLPLPEDAASNDQEPPSKTENSSRTNSRTKLPFPNETMTLRNAHKNLNKLYLERGRRFSMPFASLLLALIAMPLGIQQPRAQKTWGVSISVCLGLFVFVFYYGLLSFGIAMAEDGVLPATLALWIPNIVVAAGAFYFHRQMSLERWQSVPHGIEQLMSHIPRFPKWREES